MQTSRWIALLIVFASWLAATQANAMTISVIDASASSSGSQTSASGGISEAVADLSTGHLGAAVDGLGISGAYAQVFFGLIFGETSLGDTITLNVSLHGTFTPGTGGIVNFYTEPSAGYPVTNQAAISCNTFNQIFHGSDCWGGLYGDLGSATNSLTFTLPVDDGTVYFNPLLQVAVGSSAVNPIHVDFLNSADFSIIVPNGTVIASNPFTDAPGTTLFRTASGTIITTGGNGSGTGTNSVPEPNIISLLATGLIAATVVRRRRTSVKSCIVHSALASDKQR